MQLIGQYDSPFVRRVAVALKTYGLPYEHRPWSVFGDADRIAAINPLLRVPTLVMDDGLAVMESAAIVEVLDELVGPERAVLARRGEARRQSLRLSALAAGVADKGVALVYERGFRETALPMWVERCHAQVSGALAMLERERAGRTSRWLLDDDLSHADVTVGAVLTFLAEALAEEIDLSPWPALQAHRAACEALPVFQEAYQAFRLSRPAKA
ncbi:MAG TPA: glutathione S-transferase family protein [Caulobacteraceae bacterium]|nr:glutathione S-transferase family protein [Caulobacteraceae bacterium]